MQIIKRPGYKCEGCWYHTKRRDNVPLCIHPAMVIPQTLNKSETPIWCRLTIKQRHLRVALEQSEWQGSGVL